MSLIYLILFWILSDSLRTFILSYTKLELKYNIPTYKKWLDNHGHKRAYQWHKMVLQYLQYEYHFTPQRINREKEGLLVSGKD